MGGPRAKAGTPTRQDADTAENEGRASGGTPRRSRIIQGELLAIFGTSFVVGLSGALSPGPVLAYTIRESSRFGFWSGPLISTGHAVLELGTVVLLVLGVGPFIAEGPGFVIVSIGGGAVLAWMGYGMVTQRVTDAPVAAMGSQGRTSAVAWKQAGAGVLVSLSNPFWALWWATVGVSFLARSLDAKLGALGIGAFYLGHILSDFTWYTVVSGAVASGRRLMTRVVYRGIILGCGAFVLALAALFLWSGLRRIV